MIGPTTLKRLDALEEKVQDIEYNLDGALQEYRRIGRLCDGRALETGDRLNKLEALTTGVGSLFRQVATLEARIVELFEARKK